MKVLEASTKFVRVEDEDFLMLHHEIIDMWRFLSDKHGGLVLEYHTHPTSDYQIVYQIKKPITNLTLKRKNSFPRLLRRELPFVCLKERYFHCLS